MDKMYNQSAVMNRFFVSPVSAPTRSSFLTGRDHLRTGVSFVQNGLENMRPEETTIAELFKSEGYATGCFGKWHNGAYYPYTPNGQGFDQFLGFCSGHWDNYFDPELQLNEKMTQRKGYITDILTDAAINFIGNNKSKPFFCYIPYNAPHSPLQVPDKYFDKYNKNLKIENKDQRAILSALYGMVECVDDNIGRLFSCLKKYDLQKNTIVVFMSDNGPNASELVPRYNGNMRGMKGQVHEGGVRVPCYIQWDGKIKHQVVESPTGVIDLLPTLMELCGISNYKTQFPVDGVSWASNLTGQNTNFPKREIFTHRYQKKLSPISGAIRTEKYRLTIEKEGIMLFDMKDDPTQKNNIYNPENSEHILLYHDYLNWFENSKKGVLEQVLIPVGYDQSPEVRISAPEAQLYGKLYVKGAPNSNWVNSFGNSSDSLCLTLDVIKKGHYSVSIEYTNSDKTGNAIVTVICGNQELVKQAPYFKTKKLPAIDRASRENEAYPQTWKTLNLGDFELNEGSSRLKIFSENISKSANFQIKKIIINHLN
jgi:arylsulfatase A